MRWLAVGVVLKMVEVEGFGSVFFFKQKTAYELRISDWSSDGCSSDLLVEAVHADRRPVGLRRGVEEGQDLVLADGAAGQPDRAFVTEPGDGQDGPRLAFDAAAFGNMEFGQPAQLEIDGLPVPRSEEHTSELQSLMRISYAVFCLKKKK